MAIQHWSDEIIVVDLSQEPEINHDLENLVELLSQRDSRYSCDVVIDFSCVDTITSEGLTELLKLRKLASQCGRRLVLCSLAPTTESIFSVTGLTELFELTDDRFTALATLEMIG